MNLINDTLLLALLHYAKRYRSLRGDRALKAIYRTKQGIRRILEYMTYNARFLDLNHLESLNLLKAKYVSLSSYFATLTSFPLIFRAYQIEVEAAVLVKAFLILSIKLLDNVNDRLHDHPQSLLSMQLLYQALTSPEFGYHDSTSVIPRAENSAYYFARQAFESIREALTTSTVASEYYFGDVAAIIKGQISSFEQKLGNGQGSSSVTLAGYLSKICEKSIGRLWLDIDLIFLENFLSSFDKDHLLMVRELRTGADYIFKSFLLYDDISDFDDDIEHGIVNSVILYAWEKEEFQQREIKMLKNRRIARPCDGQTIRDIVALGDLFFAKGVAHLRKASEDARDLLDVGALEFVSRILRAFTIRKLVANGDKFDGLKHIARSFLDLHKMRLSVPDYVLKYEMLVDSSINDVNSQRL